MRQFHRGSLISFLSCLLDDVLILSNVIDLLNDRAHKHLLSDVTDEQRPYHHEEVLETSDITEESEDVRHSPFVGVEHLVGADVHGSQVALRVAVVVLVCADVQDLMKLLFFSVETTDLEDLVLH